MTLSHLNITVKVKSHERAYLAELLADFPVNPELNSEIAIIIIQARYAALLRNPSELGDILKTPEKYGFLSASSLPKMMHEFLYQEILSNAGEYRSLNEPQNGDVFFGPQGVFRGSDPSRIEFEIRDIFPLLQLENVDPVRNVATFYQRFVQIHPFYDANGRIGRAISTAYLDLHELHMNWEAMEKNAQWLKRLNHCHKRYSKPSYDTHLTYHVEHWRKFIIPKKEIYSEQEIDVPTS